MPILVSGIRRLGLMPLFKTMAESGFGALGYSVVPTMQVPEKTWMGLREYPIRTIFDVGANRGLWAQKALKAFPNATIHSFEPLPDMFVEISAVAEKSSGRIVPHNFALGEEAGKSTFEMSIDRPATSSVLKMTDATHELFPDAEATETISIDIQTLDDIAPTLSPSIVGDIFVKMDVQGFEDRVIRGGRKTIATARAVLLEVLVDDLYEGQTDFRTIFNLMDELGFSFVGTFEQYCDPKSGKAVFMDAVFVKNA